VLVFTRTKHGADKLTRQLNDDGISALALHGNKSQSVRSHALAEFKRRKLRVLVATDIAARGIDIDELPHVVNYDLPNVPEDYVHRIGRTGRAGSAGQAISLVCVDEHGYLRDIERLIKKPIAREAIAGFADDASARLAVARPIVSPPRRGHGAPAHARAKPGARPAAAAWDRRSPRAGAGSRTEPRTRGPDARKAARP
jgi:ATP-dependent RNA helicase RhlE